MYIQRNIGARLCKHC